MTTFGIIGTGQMGGAMARALRKKIDGSCLYLANRTPEKAASLALELNAAVCANEAAAGCSYVLLAVKPQTMPALMEALRPVLAGRADRFVLVSVAAGLDIASIQAMAGAKYPVIRIMPNTPVSIGAGMCLYCASPEVEPREQEILFDALSAAGRFDEITEAQMNVGTTLTGCSPAFVSLFLEAMADGGVACGLPRAKALEYAAQAIAGTAQLYLASHTHPGELKDAVCSPAGSTIEGVRVLERQGFRSAVIEAVEAATVRADALGKLGRSK